MSFGFNVSHRFFHIPSSLRRLPSTIKFTPRLFEFRRHREATMTMMTTAAPSPSLPVHVRDSIELSEKEKRIFNRLLQVLEHFSLQTQLRVAGGWVRDKLLGKECYDIDIALDNMLGKEFCEKVNEYLEATGEETQGIGVIQCNPEQSKHLETARMRIYDVWIDFVNLRAEDYTANSRIPTMKFGTALEDAYRRDLTINSLFYNINTCSVEDFTERGLDKFSFSFFIEISKQLQFHPGACLTFLSLYIIPLGIADLKSGNIVTPLPPKETFLDDPLRVLRAIRFGARFEFRLDEELKKAAADDDVRTAVANKISRERIGHEVDLMISGNQPVQAMVYISDLMLFWIIFCLPAAYEPAMPKECDRLCSTYMDAAWRLMQIIGASNFSDEQRRLSLYGALFLPLRKTVFRDSKTKEIPVTTYIFRNSLKLKSDDAQKVVGLHDAIEKFVALIPFIMSDEYVETAEVSWKKEIIDVPVAAKRRILFGLLLRVIEELWRPALMLSTLLYPTSIVCDSTSDKHFELEKRLELYKRTENAILKLDLDEVWKVKPLINGREIMGVLNLKTGGPIVREWQQKLTQWQLANPSGTADEIVDWMKQTHSKRARTE